MTNELERLNKELRETSQEIDRLYEKIKGNNNEIKAYFYLPDPENLANTGNLHIEFTSKHGTNATFYVATSAKGKRYIEIYNSDNIFDVYFHKEFTKDNYKSACELFKSKVDKIYKIIW